jgi:hypothetical protein
MLYGTQSYWGLGLRQFSKGPKGVEVSLPSPEDGNSSSFRNVVLSSF